MPPADLNNDAREDLISGQQVNSPMPGMSVILANGDGTYGPPHDYQFPNTTEISHSIMTADVNQDGYLDIIVTAASAGFYEYLNNHDGTFHLQATFLPPSGKGFWVGGAGDFNHDGRVDLALDCYVLNSTSNNICVYFGNPDGGFEVGPVIPVSAGFAIDFLVGDYDGDGNSDLAMVKNNSGSTTVDFWYGDGTGRFQEFGGAGTDSPQVAYQVGDVDGDGKSDLIGAPMGVQQNFIVYYGNAARTQEHQIIPLSHCTAGYKPTIADFNGDGFPDLAVVTMADCTDQPSDWPHTVTVKYGQGNRSFGPESRLFDTTTGIYEVFAARTDQDSKPDIVTVHYTAMNPETDIIVFRNTTSGSNFPSCLAPVDSYFGINICSPGSSTTDNNVHFGIGAAGQTAMRKVEVWVDGAKLSEQFAHAFSHYAFMDYDTTLSAGTHTVDVYAAGWDNLIQHTSFQTNVASGTGAGGCGQPTAPGVSICKPVAGGTYPSPVQISAAGRNSGPTDGMDVWLDGKKVGWYPGTSVNIQVPAAAGPHQLDIYAVGVNGELQHASVTFTVGSTSGGGGGGTGGTCPVSSTQPAVFICAPSGTVTSPFEIKATAYNIPSPDGMDVWIDGVKYGWYGGTTNLDITGVNLGPGQHQLDIYAVSTNGSTTEGSEVFTVSGTSGGTCGAPSSPGVTICSPANGSTVNSPVHIQAYGRNSGTTDGMDVWLDGVKVGWYNGTSVDISVNVGSGSHQLDIYAVGTNGELQVSTVHFNVP